jgi:hypothetical protein
LQSLTELMTPPRTSEERAHYTFWALGAGMNGSDSGHEPMEPHPVPLDERLRKLPGALVLTAGYYAGRVPMLRKVLERES